MLESLKDEDIEKAMRVIKEGFFDPAKTDDHAVKLAAFEGLVRRLSPGAAIVSSSPRAATEGPPFLAEILDGHIGYLRLGSLGKDALAQTDAALRGFAEKQVDALILDLRGVPEGVDFETAADCARRFCAKGKLLFSIQKPSAKQERIFTSNQDPAFGGIIVVLTDADTSGAAEALAGTLRLNAGAMVVGAKTTGEALEFIETPLTGDINLRVAVAQVILPETGPIFPGGVAPDVTAELPREVQAQIFRESKEKGVSQFVFESERHRMNEASLVANLNPEIDTAQSVQRERNKPPQLRDVVLQRAVDLVTAISFYKGARP